MALRKTPERFRYGQHLKVCEEADTCHATLSPFPSLDSNSFYPFGFSEREGRCVASMHRISVPHCRLLLSSPFPLSASFFRLLFTSLCFSFFYGTLKLCGTHATAGGAIQKRGEIPLLGLPRVCLYDLGISPSGFSRTGEKGSGKF